MLNRILEFLPQNVEREICKKEGIDVVLAVGGGSVIDCTKLIVAAAKYDGDAWDLVTVKQLQLKHFLWNDINNSCYWF